MIKAGPAFHPCYRASWESYVGWQCAIKCTIILNLPWTIDDIGNGAQAAATACAAAAVPPTPADPNPIGNQAIRHCLTTAIMSCQLGDDCTRCIANNREYWQPTCATQTCSATLRGIANNNNGVDLPIWCGHECEDCTKAYNQVQLDTSPEIPDTANPDPRCKKIKAGTLTMPGYIIDFIS